MGSLEKSVLETLAEIRVISHFKNQPTNQPITKVEL